jgi:hypothetical protein
MPPETFCAACQSRARGFARAWRSQWLWLGAAATPEADSWSLPPGALRINLLHPLGGGRHVDLVDTERCQRIEDRIDDGLRCGHATGLTRALDTELVYRSRQFGERNVERRQIIGARQRVVRKRTAQQLARLPVVDRVFEECLPDALGYSALDLAPRQHWIYQPPVIVDRKIAFERHRPGLGVDLDLGGVTAIGKVKTSESL